MRGVVDEYLAAGELETAEVLTDRLYVFARQLPANQSNGFSYYQLRVYYLLETADRYIDLGRGDRAEAILGEVEALRTADGLQNLTRDETWAYAPTLVECLCRLGRLEEAVALAGTIPDTYLNYLGRQLSGANYQGKSLKLIATYQALAGDLPASLQTVDGFAAIADQIEALTYYADQKLSPYIALSLIGNDRLEEARAALAEAVRRLPLLSPASDQEFYLDRIRRGYVKIADLYAEAGSGGEAAQLLGEAELLLPNLAGAKYLVDSLVDIALGYNALGQVDQARRLLTQAVGELRARAAQLAAADQSDLLGTVAEGYLATGDRTDVLAVLGDRVQAALAIFDPTQAYADAEHDQAADREAAQLIAAARSYAAAGRNDLALAALAEARRAADALYTPAKRTARYINSRSFTNDNYDHLVGAHVLAGDISGALALADTLPAADRYLAIRTIAGIVAGMDDFPANWVATIDTDKDGRPDFFSPLATEDDIAPSGLILDDDCDGDGIADARDWRPLFRDL